jgi:hypothetical protein
LYKVQHLLTLLPRRDYKKTHRRSKPKRLLPAVRFPATIVAAYILS